MSDLLSYLQPVIMALPGLTPDPKSSFPANPPIFGQGNGASGVPKLGPPGTDVPGVKPANPVDLGSFNPLKPLADNTQLVLDTIGNWLKGGAVNLLFLVIFVILLIAIIDPENKAGKLVVQTAGSAAKIGEIL